MKYKKKFNKDKTRVTITLTDDSHFHDHEKRKYTKKRTFEVVKKERIYKKIKLKKSIDLRNKYIKGFSLDEYRRNNNIKPEDYVTLKNLNVRETFFEATEDGNFDFSRTIFEGSVSFYYAKFGDGDVIFDRANFADGNVCFRFANFGEGYISFKDAIFGNGDVDFEAVNFGKGVLSFEDTIFGNGDVSFGFAYFGNTEVDFANTDFGNGGVSFMGANFGNKSPEFICTTFGEGNICFYGVNLESGSLSFESVNLPIGSGKWEWDMAVKRVKSIDFSNQSIYHNIDFSYDDDTLPIVNEVRFINTKIYGKIHIDYDTFKLGDAINVQADTSHREKRDQFLLFKENFRSLGKYDDEDKAYYWFKYHQIRADAEIIKFDNWKEKIKKKLVYGFKKIAFEWIGKYGTSPGRVFLTMIIAILSFAIFYLLLPPINYQNHSPLFHSIITFLTIGYGTDYINLNLLGKILSGIEGFLGLFLIAYFTISFARKVIR